MDVGSILYHPLMQADELPEGADRDASPKRIPSTGSDSALESSPPISPQSYLEEPLEYGYMAPIVAESDRLLSFEDEGYLVSPPPGHVVTYPTAALVDGRIVTDEDTEHDIPNIFANVEEGTIKEFIPDAGESIRITALSNVVSLPTEGISTVRKLAAAIKYKDTEGMIEYSLKAFSIPFGMANASADLTGIAYVLLQGIKLTAVTVSSFVLGVIFLTIEFLLEATRLIRTIGFRETYKIEARLDLIKKFDFNPIFATTGSERVNALETVSFNLSKEKPKIDKLLGLEESNRLCGEIQGEINTMLSDNLSDSSQVQYTLVNLQLALSASALSMIHVNYLNLSDAEEKACHEALNQADLIRKIEASDRSQPPSHADIRQIRAELEVLFGEKKAEEFFLRCKEAMVETENQTGLSFDAHAALYTYEELIAAARENKLRGKLNALARRIQPATALNISKKMESKVKFHQACINGGILDSSKPVEINKLMLSENVKDLSKINMESKKTMIVHAIGIAAVTLGVLSIAFSFAGFPPAAVAVIVILGIITQMHRGKAKEAFLDQDGYKWDRSYLIPEFIRNLFKAENPLAHRRRLVPLTFDRELESHVTGSAQYGHNYSLEGRKLGPMVGSPDEKPSKPSWIHKIPYLSFFL